MRVPHNWLLEFVDLQDSPEELAERLSLSALEVDEIERPGQALDGVVAGRLAEVERHPGADKLTLCKVDIGTGELQPVVCGAQNHKQGDFVALATPGTVLPGNFKIKKSKIRGEVSLGMLCSLSELGFSGEYDGILILDGEPELGSSVAELIGLEPAIYEIDLLPDRGDCASVLGIAREFAALYDLEIPAPIHEVAEEKEPIGDALSVENRAPDGCHDYLARLVRGVTVGPSPEWLARRLESLGLRPINNIVDVTNYVLMELGQPLHAFDAAKIPDGRIVVRRAEQGEKLALLDDQEAVLVTSDLVIADADHPIALAGVMGGAETAVSDTTRDVILEAALFAPASIRRTVRQHGLRSDSSYRFERGVDPEGVCRALDRAAQLLAELAGGEVAAGVACAAGERAPRPEVTTLLPARVQRLLGLGFSDEEIGRRLERVGVAVERTGDGLRCSPPSWRLDLVQEADYLEEILRLDGYEAIPETLPLAPMVIGPSAPALAQNTALRQSLVQHGFSEARNLAFVSASDLLDLGLPEEAPERGRLVALQNPLGEEMAFLRTSLLPGLLRGAARNLRRGVCALHQFEIGKLFFSEGAGELPREFRRLAGVSIDSEDPQFWKSTTEGDAPFFRAKAALCAALGVQRCAVEVVADESPAAYFHPSMVGAVRAGKRPLGTIGRIHPDVARRFELPAQTLLFELDLDAQLAVGAEPRVYEAAPRHQSVVRDFAVLVDSGLPAGRVAQEIRRTAVKQLEELEIFDQYEGTGVPEGRKSLAFRLTLRAKDRTLTDKEVSKTMDRVLANLQRELGAEQR